MDLSLPLSLSLLSPHTDHEQPKGPALPVQVRLCVLRNEGKGTATKTVEHLTREGGEEGRENREKRRKSSSIRTCTM